MENIPGNMGRNVTFEKILVFLKSIVSSTFLIVDDRGNRTPVKNFAAIAAVAASLFFIFAVGAVTFCILYKTVKHENIKLAKEIDFANRRLDEMRDEKDILLAKVVLNEVESKNRQKAAKDKSSVSLSLKNFVAFQNSDNSGWLKVHFYLIVDGALKKDASLRVLAVLKTGGKNKKKWLFFPDDAFDSGKPSQSANGFRYSTNSSDPIKLDIKNKKKSGAFKFLKIYLFDISGNLLSEKDFPI